MGKSTIIALIAIALLLVLRGVGADWIAGQIRNDLPGNLLNNFGGKLVNHTLGDTFDEIVVGAGSRHLGLGGQQG